MKLLEEFHFPRLVRSLAILSTAAFLTGCAWTKTPVNIQLVPVASAPLAAPAKTAVHVGEVTDERVASDPRAVMQKYNAYGKTTGAYVADRPVSELFREALEATLQTNRFQLGDKASTYELKSSIKSAGQDFMQTGLFTARVVSTLTVRFELVQSATGDVVWRDTITGKSDENTGTAGAGFVERNFKASAEDVLRQLVSDSLFRKNFQ